MKQIFLFFAFIFLSYSCDNKKFNTTTFSSNEINHKVDSIVNQMTLDEKVGQMTQIDQRFLDTISDLSTYSIGSLLSGGGSTPKINKPDEWLKMYNRYQKEAMNSRLKIPLVYGIDAVHGHNNVVGATIFPHNIGLGATRNEELVTEIGKATAIAVNATGIDWTFAPCLTNPKDYRWGRTYEGFSDDPKLVARLGVAAIKGIQDKSISNGKSVIACAKHFIGDGNTEFGTGMNGLVDRGDVKMSLDSLRKELVPKYQESIDAGVMTVMASYNMWNGIRCHASKELLTDLLKDEMGFQGFVVSDWEAIDQIPGDYKSDIEISINAGIDMVMVSGEGQPYKKYIRLLKENVNEGLISMERIDDAVSRILKVKFLSGLYENPFVENDKLNLIGSDKHRNLGRQAVRESIVVLKNDEMLPISKNINNLVVAGRGADNIGMQCGGWSIAWQGGQGRITKGTSILEGIKKTVANNTNLVYSIDGKGVDNSNGEVAIIVIGEDPYTEWFGDVEKVEINNEDLKTIQRLKSKGYRVMVLLISGRPMNISDHIDGWDGFASLWLPGTEGIGVSDILFGDYSSTGKLSFPWPIQVEDGALSSFDKILFDRGFGL